MTQIPLHHRGRPTGQLITIDDHLSTVLSRVHWSTGDIRRPQSPRYVARFHGEPLTLSLNRVIYALSHKPNLIARDIFDSELGLLKHEMALHPPLIFVDDNVLNCTLANILPRALSRKGQRPRDTTGDSDSPPLAPAPSHLDTKILGKETAERMANVAPFVPHATRDVNGDANLSKLFTHLDASSDASLTNKKGHTDDKRPA